MGNKEHKRFLEVGWLMEPAADGSLWGAPRPLDLPSLDDASGKAVTACPAVLQHEARIYEVLCPFDAHLSATVGAGGGIEFAKRDTDGDKGLQPEALTAVSQDHWRDSRRPLIRISTPLRFVSDQTCHLTVLAPMHDYKGARWPGVVVSERFRVDLWPRRIDLNFEWHDLDRPLQLERGEPLLYLRFEGRDPTRSTQLFEAERSPELTAHIAAVDEVCGGFEASWSRFRTDLKQRPEALVVRKGRKG